MDNISSLSYFMMSNRLGFRTWQRTNDETLAHRLWGNPHVSKFITASGLFSEDDIRNRFDREIANQIEWGVQYWPIFLLSTNEFVGCCGLRPYKPDEQILEFGCHLLPEYWGMAIAAEAAGCVFNYCFVTSDLRVSALFAGHNPNNAGSKAMLLKLGFRFTHDEYYQPTGLMHPSYLLTSLEYSASESATAACST